MKPTAPVIGSLEYATLLVGSVLASTLFVWPLHIVMVAGENATISMLMAGAFSMLFILLQVIAWTPNESAPLMEWVLTATGVILTLVVDALVLVLFIDMLKEFFFPETPRVALVAPLALLTGWWATASWKRIARRAQFWVPLMLVGSLVPIFLSFFDWAHPVALAPHSWTAFVPEMQGVAILAYVVVPLGATARVAARRLAGSARDRVRAGLGAIFGLWLWLALVFATTVGSLGTDALVHLSWPLVYVLEEATLDSSFVVSRPGVLTIFGWSALIVIALVVHLRLAITVAEDLNAGGRSIGLVAIGIGEAAYWAGVVLLDTAHQASALLISEVDPVAAGLIILEVLVAATVVGLRTFRRRSRRTSPSQPVPDDP
ncbi:MAG: GerAB/ArcD/ProY family transporter [Clostridia bacterium]